MKKVYKLALVGAGVLLGLRMMRSSAKGDYSYGGKVVMITGGSRGLGLAMARRLQAEGARLAIIARHEKQLHDAEEDLRSRGCEVRSYVCDVRDKGQVDSTVQQIKEDFGRIDVLINNAGLIMCAPFDNQVDEDFENTLGTNFYGPLYLVRAVLPIMRQQGGGRILNVSSVSGKIGIPHMSAYSTSKHALVGFSHAIAAELRQENIHVTVACPGLMRTGAHRSTRFRGQYEKEHAWFTTANVTPVLGGEADKSACQLLEALRDKEIEVMFPWQWRLAAIGSGVFPGLSVMANALVNRGLPKPAANAGEAVPGRKVHRIFPPEWYMRNAEEAADDLNQKE